MNIYPPGSVSQRSQRTPNIGTFRDRAAKIHLLSHRQRSGPKHRKPSKRYRMRQSGTQHHRNRNTPEAKGAIQGLNILRSKVTPNPLKNSHHNPYRRETEISASLTKSNLEHAAHRAALSSTS